jgi:hypothetical protein
MLKTVLRTAKQRSSVWGHCQAVLSLKINFKFKPLALWEEGARRRGQILREACSRREGGDFVGAIHESPIV